MAVYKPGIKSGKRYGKFNKQRLEPPKIYVSVWKSSKFKQVDWTLS
jgi:hypothetical protein